MKKSLMILGMLAVGFANAQQGNVGINTTAPKGTLEVQPNAENAQTEATTNEGIIAPRLSKTRIANIANPIEGTLVYATDETTSPISAYTGGNTKVAKITEKGYYFYNGTEWVKAGNDATDQLWAQRDNNGITETYLKPVDGTYDRFSFEDKGDGKGKAYVRILGETNLTLTNYPSNFVNYRDLSINYELFTSKAFPIQNQIGPSAFYDFNHKESVVEPTHIANTTSTTLKYNGGFNALRVFENLGKDINYLNGQTFIAQTGSPEKVISQNIANMVGSQSGVELFTTGNINAATALMTSANNWESGNIGNLVGARITASNEKATVRNQESLIVVNNLNSGNISNIMRGINLQSSTKQGASVLDYVGISHRLLSETDITNQYIGIFNSIKPTQNLTTTIKNFFGYRLDINRTEGNLSSENAYGLHMDDIDFATGDNFAIYTNAGQIRFGDLRHSGTTNVAGSGDRPVYVTADGILKIGNPSTALSSRIWQSDGNNIKLAIKADGSDRVDNVITINDEGQLLATSFRGKNGVEIFPDYVFQKYYTGASSIKSDYNFKSLSQVEDFVKANGHLPGYKSAETIKAQGYVDLMETQLTNVEKIEELYLHSIEQDKALKAKDAEIADLKQRLERLEKLIK